MYNERINLTQRRLERATRERPASYTRLYVNNIILLNVFVSK